MFLAIPLFPAINCIPAAGHAHAGLSCCQCCRLLLLEPGAPW